MVQAIKKGEITSEELVRSYINEVKKNSNAKIVIFFHNDPLSMQGSKSPAERLFIFETCSKIVVISNWIKRRLIKNLNLNIIDLEKIVVIHHSTDKPKKINFKQKKKSIIFVGKLNKAKGYDLFGQAIIKILNKLVKIFIVETTTVCPITELSE